MSEGFDKEAERERLREKYESDREDREATERMSELLLQGATMTNKHCDTCGSPIFRYDGQEFCPNCQYEAQAKEAESQSQVEEQPQPSGDTTASTEDETGEQPPATDQGGVAKTQDSAGDDEVPSEGSVDDSVQHHGRQPTAPEESTSLAAHADIESTARASSEEAAEALLGTITTLAQRAAQSSDPRRAQELLAAANEAAATLETLRGNP